MRSLTKSEQQSLDALKAALSGASQQLGDIDNPACAPTRVEAVRALLRKGEHNWTPEDIDWVFFKAATTIGSEETVKYALPRLLGCLLRDELTGSVSGPIIPDKLDYAKFEEWPEAERRPTLDVLSKLATLWATDDFHDGGRDDLLAFIGRHQPN